MCTVRVTYITKRFEMEVKRQSSYHFSEKIVDINVGVSVDMEQWTIG